MSVHQIASIPEAFANRACLTIPEAAGIIGCSENHVRDMLTREVLAAVRTMPRPRRGRVLVSKDSLERFLRAGPDHNRARPIRRQ